MTPPPNDVAYRGRLAPPRDLAGPPPLPATRSVQVYLPETFCPPFAQEFRARSVTASPGAGAIEPAELVTQIPDGMLGIIRVFEYDILGLLAGTDVRWSLLINGGAPAGCSAFRFFPGAAPRVTSSEDVYVRVPKGARISVRIQNNDGAAYTVGAFYSGWFWDEDAARDWLGQGAS